MTATAADGTHPTGMHSCHTTQHIHKANSIVIEKYVGNLTSFIHVGIKNLNSILKKTLNLMGKVIFCFVKKPTNILVQDRKWGIGVSGGNV